MRNIMLTFIVILMTVVISSATIIHVPSEYSTIQEALDVSFIDDTVMVAAGTYYENIIWPFFNGIKLLGENRDITIIDGGGLASVIRFDEPYVIDTATAIRGFTITNGSAQSAWPQSLGGGICIYNASPILEQLNIVGNSADESGGGIFIRGPGSEPIIRNTLIYDNTATSCGGLDCSGGSALFDHVTVVGNDPGGMYFDTRGYPQVNNSIISSNSIFDIRIRGTSLEPTTIAMGFNDITGDIQLIHYGIIDYQGVLINDDPLFVDSEDGDFHLTVDSPCIDAGDPDDPYDPDATITDLGAFYFNQQTSIENIIALPEEISILQNYPNPFNVATTISLTIPETQQVRIDIYDVLGRQVGLLVDDIMQAGDYNLKWQAEDYVSGVYFARLKTGGQSNIIRMALIK